MYRKSSMRLKVFPIFSYLSEVQFSVTNFFCFHIHGLYLCYKKKSAKNKIFPFLVGPKRNFGIAASNTKKRIRFKIESNGAIIVFF